MGFMVGTVDIVEPTSVISLLLLLLAVSLHNIYVLWLTVSVMLVIVSNVNYIEPMVNSHCYMVSSSSCVASMVGSASDVDLCSPWLAITTYIVRTFMQGVSTVETQ